MKKVSDLNNLYKAYLKSKKGSTWKPQIQMYEMDYLTKLVATSNELEDAKASFKSWYGSYEKLLSFRTRNNIKTLYNELFAEH